MGASARVSLASEGGDGFDGSGSGMPRTGPIGLAEDGSKAAKEHVGASARVSLASEDGDGFGGGGSGIAVACRARLGRCRLEGRKGAHGRERAC